MQENSTEMKLIKSYVYFIDHHLFALYYSCIKIVFKTFGTFQYHTYILNSLDDLALLHTPNEDAISGSAARNTMKVTRCP